MNNNRILVTGGAGFIGSHLVDALLDKKYEVFIVDDLSTGKIENLNDIAGFYFADITTNLFYKAVQLIKPYAIFHFAAQMDIRKSVKNPLFDANVNILGTINVAKAAKDIGTKKIIFASTGGAIYGEKENLPTKESEECNPICPYGVAKLSCEKYLEYFTLLGGPSSVFLRYSNVYGPRQNPKGEAGVVSIFSDKLINKNPIAINGDGTQTRDFIYIDDVTNANLLALEVNDISGPINIGTSRKISINMIAETLCEEANIKFNPLRNFPKDGEQKHSCLDTSRAKKLLGWKAKVPFELGLKETFRSFKQ
jgi:UDP-glucose 4-epimerase